MVNDITNGEVKRFVDYETFSRHSLLYSSVDWNSAQPTVVRSTMLKTAFGLCL